MPVSMPPVLTIDGPSGAGKGTVSRSVARHLGWNYLDSGAIYRSLGIAIKNAGIELDQREEISELALKMDLSFQCHDSLQVFLAGQEITHQLSLESTGHIASVIAAYPQVRSALLQKQKDFRLAPGLVADGRDMGTVVFPDAQYKVFLTASAEARAKRRYKQLIEKGIDVNLTQITQEIEARDQRDRERATAPLVQAETALYLDSTALSIDEVVEKVINHVQ